MKSLAKVTAAAAAAAVKASHAGFPAADAVVRTAWAASESVVTSRVHTVRNSTTVTFAAAPSAVCCAGCVLVVNAA